jgi:indolepyruvate ferredoxin oxidoreductase
VFGWSKERRMERRMIADYERLIDEIARRLSPANHATAMALASLPLEVKGFGHVKLRNAGIAKERQDALLAELRNPTPAPVLRAAE